MSPSSSSRSSKPKPAEVAAETKKFLKKYGAAWQAFSYLFAQPLAITPDQFPPRPMASLAPPIFRKCSRSKLPGRGVTCHVPPAFPHTCALMSRICVTDTLCQTSAKAIPWTLQQAGQRRLAPRSCSSVLPTRSDLAETGRRVSWATKSACAGGAICRRTCKTQRSRTTRYLLKEDFTLAVSVSLHNFFV